MKNLKGKMLTKKSPVAFLMVLIIIQSFLLTTVEASNSNIYVKDLAISPSYSSDKTMFAATRGAGIFKTVDGGQNWSQLSLGRGHNTMDIDIINIWISPDFQNDKFLFALFRNYRSHNGLINSFDGGKTWNFVGSSVYYSYKFSPNFANDKTIFGLDSSFDFYKNYIYKSTDNGNTWSDISYIKGPLIDIFPSPSFATDQTIFASSFDGIYRSTDGGLSWVYLLKGLSLAGEISPNFANDKTFFSAIDKNVIKSDDGGISWLILQNGINGTLDDFYVSPDYENDQTIFALTDVSEDFREFKYSVYKSTDGGLTWAKKNNFKESSYKEGLNLDLTISPDFKNDNTLFATGFDRGLYKSLDDGVNWIPINNGLYKPKAKLNLLSNLNRTKKGRSVIIKGRLRKKDGKPFANRIINISANRKTIKKVRTNKYGIFQLKVSPIKTITYYAIFEGDYSYSYSRSKVIKIAVSN